MKFKTFALAVLAAAGSTNMASADVTVDITGATAFRQAAVNAILNSFNTTPPVQFGFTGTNFNSATAHIFRGSFPGVTGTTTIRTFWSGSTEGATVVSNDQTEARYIEAIPANLAVAPGLNNRTNASNGTPEMYFSDCGIESTNPATVNHAGVLQDVLGPSNVGAIVFTMIKNEAPAAYAGLTNITSQQFRALFSPANSGRARLSQFTGLNTDDNLRVYATGRNDLSGTRTIYLAETGYGFQNFVAQWKITSNGSNEITTLQAWPPNDGANASTQWAGQNVAGNGGYSSGSTLTGLLDDTSASVAVLSSTGSVIPGEQGLPACLITFLANADAAGAITNGAVALSYNGVGITPNAGGLSAADKAKVQNGTYTLWSFEKFIPSDEIVDPAFADHLTVYLAVQAGIESNIGSAGLTLAEMSGVERATDGGVVIVTP